jgi:hypothetical protein
MSDREEGKCFADFIFFGGADVVLFCELGLAGFGRGGLNLRAALWWL